MQFVAASVVVAVVVHLIYVLDVTLAIAARPQLEQHCPSPPLPPLALLRSLCVACEIRQAQIANGRQQRQEIPLCIGVRVCVGAWEGVGSAGIGNWDLWPLPMGRLICDSRRLLTHR